MRLGTIAGVRSAENRDSRGVSADRLVGWTLASDVRDRLRADIIACVLKLDERLRLDALREALTQFVSDRLVATEGRRGLRVAPVAQRGLIDVTEARVTVDSTSARPSRASSGWRASLARPGTAP